MPAACASVVIFHKKEKDIFIILFTYKFITISHSLKTHC